MKVTLLERSLDTKIKTVPCSGFTTHFRRSELVFVYCEKRMIVDIVLIELSLDLGNVGLFLRDIQL
jgi:hypothetical protein